MLTYAQQSALDYHLRQTNLLTNEELILELTDHYTTALTEKMAQGMSLETALTDVQTAFGGFNGLQKMERQYNRVTFRHYDETWRQLLVEQFRTPLLGCRTLPFYLLILIFSWLIYKPTSVANFAYGATVGALIGSAFIWLGMLWPYLKTLILRGLHNVPTEVLYILKRQIIFLLPFYTVGGLGHYILPVFTFSVQLIFYSLYLFIYYLFIRTSRSMHELLYEPYMAH